jgi:hypothetical protein
LPDHFLGKLNHKLVITGHGSLLKWRQDELAVLPVLRPIHARETKSYPTLRRTVRAVDELAGRAKFRGIAQDLAIKFRTNGQDVQFGRFAKGNRPERQQASVLLLELTHASDRISKKMDVFTGRVRAGQDIVFHQLRH